MQTSGNGQTQAPLLAKYQGQDIWLTRAFFLEHKRTNSQAKHMDFRNIQFDSDILHQWYSTWGTRNPGVREDILGGK